MGKDFKGKANITTTPAEQFISTKETAQGGTAAPVIPEGYKLVPVEKKTQRVQLVLRPSLLEKAKERAKAEGISFNELCHIAIEDYLKK